MFSSTVVSILEHRYIELDTGLCARQSYVEGEFHGCKNVFTVPSYVASQSIYGGVAL